MKLSCACVEVPHLNEAVHRSGDQGNAKRSNWGGSTWMQVMKAQPESEISAFRRGDGAFWGQLTWKLL
ncbi:unnamed protein product [Pleuronectes platessa]|uniref:Uncharacterized protein n=1 Tax=Pleuronectes platessa TaxID=8262 RepID=A0A9N7UL64_PLEPL|nr:unnamed protein product [Pleuronectes platessa]